MNEVINRIFRSKKTFDSALINYGFTLKDNAYIYTAALESCGFTIKIVIVPPSDMSADVYDDEGELYTLHLVSEACGGFVGQVRGDYEKALSAVAESCFTYDVFKARQAQLVAQYARNTYNDELEFLWEKFPDCAVLRRKDSGKWYAIIMTAAASKFGLEGEKTEILDVRANPEELQKIIDNRYFFAGYHMNKKHWLTILLDCGVDIKTIYKYIDDSYILAKK